MYNAMSVVYKEKLIDLVKLNPGLWRQSRKAPGLKQKIWDNIGAELETTGYDARRQWEILRDQLRRENKRFKQNPNYKSKWMFYTKMLFTLPKNEAQGSACSDDGEQYHPDHQMHQHENYHYLTIPKTEEEQTIIQVRKDLQESNDDYLPSMDAYSSAPMTAVAAAAAATASTVEDYYPSTSAGVSSSTQIPRYTTENVDHCETARRIPTRNKRYPDGSPEDDEDYYFAMSLVPSLRCIPRSRKLRIRSKIMDLIAAALENEYEQDNNNIMSLREDVNVNNEIEEQIITPHQIVPTSMEKMN